ncbi:MAG: hypothetical protein BGO82_10980 [Devosia sp. 67-54]|uniref:DUF1236 domain-containing protein n=1 Tax=unclassified Devosia TaxID=196773 RepID=UPI00095F6C31|nr:MULTISPECIES: DUF1236 domain-containing protein [unclassified Devosia]MBN9304839.1 DUF1236 domain-containing protein [Devosia sp.]OJX15205.1 MAG: hypothetical protein BGO82_10980 [Devosia sp. 67-54]
MRKLLLAGVAVLSLGAATLPAAYAASTLGAAAGATTGSTLGFIFGGPVGAIIGGFSGAVVGSTVPDTSVTFAGTHPVEQVYLKDHVKVGYKVGGTVKLYPIDGDDAHAYFYANNRVWIVDRSSGKIVASPGFVVSDRTVAYVKAHPTGSVRFSGSLAPGAHLKSSVRITAIPDARGYGYVYLNDRPALVDTGSRTVVWVE